MEDKVVSVGCVVAVVLWASATLLTLGGTVAAFTMTELELALALMCHALLVAAGAATWTVRMMLQYQNRLLREVFNLGRRAGGGISKIR